MQLDDIKPHLMVHAKGDRHVGTVDHLAGENFIKLARKGSSDGKHHFIPVAWVESVDGEAVHLSKTEDEFRAGLLDEIPPTLQ